MPCLRAAYRQPSRRCKEGRCGAPHDARDTGHGCLVASIALSLVGDENRKPSRTLSFRIDAIGTNSNAPRPSSNCSNIWRGPMEWFLQRSPSIGVSSASRRPPGKYVTDILGSARGRQAFAPIQHRALAAFFTGPALPTGGFSSCRLATNCSGDRGLYSWSCPCVPVGLSSARSVCRFGWSLLLAHSH